MWPEFLQHRYIYIEVDIDKSYNIKYGTIWLNSKSNDGQNIKNDSIL